MITHPEGNRTPLDMYTQTVQLLGVISLINVPCAHSAYTQIDLKTTFKEGRRIRNKEKEKEMKEKGEKNKSTQFSHYILLSAYLAHVNDLVLASLWRHIILVSMLMSLFCEVYTSLCNIVCLVYVLWFCTVLVFGIKKQQQTRNPFLKDSLTYEI